MNFDKYEYYQKAVQGPDADVEFLRDTYRAIRGRKPTTLREDFCGTFAVCCEWVKLGPKYRAFGVDLDHDPIEYGRNQLLPKLKSHQRDRVTILQDNVLNPGLPHADVIAAFNFSYFTFKDRATMKSYFHNCFNTLNQGGLFAVDVFGGSQCFSANEDRMKYRNFVYYWEQEAFDPVTHFSKFHIHFKVKGQKRFEKVFSYDWRMWSIPEVREMMMESGFSKTHVYWEGTTRSGTGDGKFRPVDQGEECEAWVAYVVGEK